MILARSCSTTRSNGSPRLINSPTRDSSCFVSRMRFLRPQPASRVFPTTNDIIHSIYLDQDLSESMPNDRVRPYLADGLVVMGGSKEHVVATNAPFRASNLRR